MTAETKHTGIIAWFATNPVAANLLMVVIIVTGLYSGLSMRRTMMPEFEIDVIQVTMAYPGAAPEEVEKGIILRLEEALSDLEGVERIEAEAQESFAWLIVDPLDGVDIIEMLNDVKTRVDAIAHFPENAEKPIIGRVEIGFQAMVLQIAGDLDEFSMKSLAEEVKTELTADPEISQVQIWGARDYEIAIEVSEHTLREYHLTLDQIAQTIAASSLDLPGGSVRTENGDIMLRTTGQAYREADFSRIVLRTFPDGTRLTVGDIADIQDGFTDTTGFAMFDGKYSIGLAIMAKGEVDVIDAADAAKAYVETKNQVLPEGVELVVWQDFSYYLDQRTSMMLTNLLMGAGVVFLVLALFLEIKLAFWVMVGIPICFLGAIALYATPLIGGTLNVLSLFAFILVLGIVVDDAIIIGESAYTLQEERGHSVDAIIEGVHRVATPATFGVLTTIVAFAPTLFVEGIFSVFGLAMGWVVIFCLAFSLIESKWILPAHLAHSKPASAPWLVHIDHIQESVNRRLRHFIDYRYRPFLTLCTDNRYTTVAAFISMLILTLGLIAGGQVRFVMAPEVHGEFLRMDLKMSEGTPVTRTHEVMRQIDRALHVAEEEHQARTGTDEKLVAHTFAYGNGLIEGAMMAELSKEEDRSISTIEVLRAWRQAVGTIPGAEVVSFSADDGPDIGADLSFDLTHPKWEVLVAASGELEEKMAEYAGVYDVRSGASSTSDEFHIDILAEGEALGISRFDLGSQVRHAFYGAEAERIQRGIDEIRVLVRYPSEDRRTTSSLESMFIRTPSGDQVPFNSVATMQVKPGFNLTTHINMRRAVEVNADVEVDIVEPARVESELFDEFLPQLVEKYPGLTFARSGMSEETVKMGRSMALGFVLALFGIYTLLAIPTKSYLQPLIIMGVIPFGIIGAVIGHAIIGYAVSMMSLLGIIALSGVVVNDSLIMVDFVNRARREGLPLKEAVALSGTRRFRAILLTSLTTFVGLVPMLLETSIQAQMIIPMAISLAFGIVFATVITLLLVPSLYMILDDLNTWWAGDADLTDTAETPAPLLPEQKPQQ